MYIYIARLSHGTNSVKVKRFYLSSYRNFSWQRMSWNCTAAKALPLCEEEERKQAILHLGQQAASDLTSGATCSERSCIRVQVSPPPAAAPLPPWFHTQTCTCTSLRVTTSSTNPMSRFFLYSAIFQSASFGLCYISCSFSLLPSLTHNQQNHHFAVWFEA